MASAPGVYSSPTFFGLFLPLMIPSVVCAGYLAVPGLHERRPGLTLTAIIVAALGLLSLPILFMVALLSHLGPVR
jgi:hypothetical protein